MEIHISAQKHNTHTPFGGIPGCKPPSEGGWLEALLDQDNGGVWISVTRVGLQILLAGCQCLFALLLICVFTDPDKHLEKKQDVIKVVEFIYFIVMFILITSQKSYLVPCVQ